jgi:hypothetical protein
VRLSECLIETASTAMENTEALTNLHTSTPRIHRECIDERLIAAMERKGRLMCCAWTGEVSQSALSDFKGPDVLLHSFSQQSYPSTKHRGKQSVSSDPSV